MGLKSFIFCDEAETTERYTALDTLSLHDDLPISRLTLFNDLAMSGKETMMTPMHTAKLIFILLLSDKLII